MPNKIHYSSIGKTVDGTTFCSGVETLAENVIEDNESDSVIVFPSATGWASLRSSSYRMTTENAEAHLPLPIYKLKRVLVKLPRLKIGKSTSDADWGGPWEANSLQNEGGQYFNNEIDITKAVVSVTEWNALFIASGRDDYTRNIRKDNTFYWEEGSDKIPFLSTVYKLGALIFADERPTYERLLYYALYNNASDYSRVIYGVSGEFPIEGTVSFSQLTVGGDAYLHDIPDVREWQFRIEYVPMSSKMKIRARKNAPTQQEYIQPFNQRAEINAASALGKNMWLTAQKTGCNEITIVKNYTKLADIPPLGALVRHNGKRYRLVANHYVQTNTVYMQVTHTLSENWSERSKHIAVDQKYRNWAIPQDILWRNLYWEDYLRVGTSFKTTGSTIKGSVALADILQLFIFSRENDKTVDVFSLTTDEDIGTVNGVAANGVILPCSTLGIANSMVFSATFKDNLSAGLRRVSSDNIYLCEEAMYCKADGSLGDATISLGKGIKNHVPIYYPSTYAVDDEVQNGVETVVFENKFNIAKDPGEALKFTYQIHVIGEDGIIIGNKFAEHNPLIKKYDTDRTIRLWFLKRYVREGTDIIETTADDEYLDAVSDDEAFTVEDEGYKMDMSAVAAYARANGYKAWALTDENKNLYVACNDTSVEALYFQLHHKR